MLMQCKRLVMSLVCLLSSLRKEGRIFVLLSSCRKERLIFVHHFVGQQKNIV